MNTVDSIRIRREIVLTCGFGLLVSVIGIAAIPVNNECSGAIEVFLDHDCIEQTLDFSETTWTHQPSGCSLPSWPSDLWYCFNLNQPSEIILTSSAYVMVIYEGSCDLTNEVVCRTVLSGSPLHLQTFLDAGKYTIQFIVNQSQLTMATFCLQLVPCPIKIDNLRGGVYSCGPHTLEPITGQNLTGNQAYYTEQSGMGDKYLPGDIITTTTQLYAYDTDGHCEDNEAYRVIISSLGFKTAKDYPFFMDELWNSSTYWEEGSVPNVCDHVAIPAPVEMTVGSVFSTFNALCYSLTIDGNASLVIPEGSSLKVTNWIDIKIGAELSVPLGARFEVKRKIGIAD